MRRKQYEITDPAVIEDILSGSEVCRIALIDDGKPYIVPLNYGYRDSTIYFHSSPYGKKIEILRKNNKVCFEIESLTQIVKKDVPCDWGTKFRSVIGYGTVEFVEDYGNKIEALNIIMAHYGKKDKSSFNEKLVKEVVILKLKIEEITGKQLGDWG